MGRLPQFRDPNLLVGTETHDDAGVYRLTADLAIVQTVDFFPPVVNDPFVYGQIAAANALSDVYAMGGVPRTALNLVGYPDDRLGLDWLAEILRGGGERVRAAAAVIVGGHTVRDAEIKYGLAVTGTVHPDRVLTNATARPGDVLVLTKPLGTGFVTTAHKRGECPDELFQAACASMIRLNDASCAAMLAVGVNAATDITGFGLAGHALGMAQGSRVTLRIQLSRLPLLAGAERLARKPYLTRASVTNRAYVAAHLREEGPINPVLREFFYDAQTSGGLLISVPAEQADALVRELDARGVTVACAVGEVLPREDAVLVLHS